MSVSEDEAPAELEFDMWEGQFEFVGPQYQDTNGNGENVQGLNGTYDENVDLFRPARKKNGFKKHHVQVWYEDLAGHVSCVAL